MVVEEDRTTTFQKLVPRIVVVALAYVAAAHIGLAFDPVGGLATLVWPASGIALAALLLGGYQLWPAIAIGAFAANILAGAPILGAIGIAAGNTAEGIVGAYLVQRAGRFRCELDRVRDVVALILFAVLLSTVIAATVGATVLVMEGIVARSAFSLSWKAWWLGDAIGNLLAAPLILVWATWKPARPGMRTVIELGALAATIIVASKIVFGAYASNNGIAHGREYLLFPPLIWAALRFGVCGAVTASVTVAIIAIAYTAAGYGPFTSTALHENLLALQTFIGVSGATFLVLGASMSERRKAAREVHAARESAESANRAKSGFLAVISHELRTPLNAIMGYVELLLLEIDGPLTEKQRSVLDRIRQSQRHLLALIDDVLGFAQVEAGRLKFALQPVAVRDVLLAVESIVGQETARKGITFNSRGADFDVFVEADPDKLRQVLLNLVTNSLKFTPAGGSIEIDTRVADDRVVIKVSDTGIGISRDNLPHVFEPFFQVDQGGTRRYPGVGLGLSIVRDAILAMNGDVAMDSEPGKGTVVTIELPVDHSNSTSATAPSSHSLDDSRESLLT